MRDECDVNAVPLILSTCHSPKVYRHSVYSRECHDGPLFYCTSRDDRIVYMTSRLCVGAELVAVRISIVRVNFFVYGSSF